MGRSPKTGRELHPERGYKAPKWVVNGFRRLLGADPVDDINYTEELRFHDDDGVSRYWEDQGGEAGLELILDALDAFEEEKDQYVPPNHEFDEQCLYWVERVEDHARKLIDQYFQQEYGYIPNPGDASQLEHQALQYRN